MAIHIPNKIVSRIMRVTCKELLDNTDLIIPISVRIFGVIKENEIIYSDSITNAENTAIKKYLLLDKTIYMTFNIFISFIFSYSSFYLKQVLLIVIFVLLEKAASSTLLYKCKYNIRNKGIFQNCSMVLFSLSFHSFSLPPL